MHQTLYAGEDLHNIRVVSHILCLGEGSRQLWQQAAQKAFCMMMKMCTISGRRLTFFALRDKHGKSCNAMHHNRNRDCQPQIGNSACTCLAETCIHKPSLLLYMQQAPVAYRLHRSVGNFSLVSLQLVKTCVRLAIEAFTPAL